MKLALIGDLHLRLRAPEGRKEFDFFHKVQFPKLKQVFNIIEKEGCDCVLQVGDWWDHPDPSKSIQAECIEFLNSRKCPIPIFSVAGQHDMIGHSLGSISRSVLRVMEASNTLRILGSNPISYKNVVFHGASFGQEIPEPIDTNKLKVLVIHALIGDKKLFPNQKLIHPRTFLREHSKFDLVVAGDYHYRYSYKVNGSLIANPGCLVRLRRNKDESLKPAIFIATTSPLLIREHLLTVKPSNEVFHPSKAKKESDFQFEEFIGQLARGGKIGVNFDANLQSYFEEYDVPLTIRNRISDAKERLVRVQKE